jgi:hypothetical protein
VLSSQMPSLRKRLRCAHCTAGGMRSLLARRALRRTSVMSKVRRCRGCCVAGCCSYRWPKSTRPMGRPKARFFGPTRARAQHDVIGPGPARARRWAVLGCKLSP